ncbi:MAG TPA: hypothetical protein PLN31_18490 [Azoarcus taiwanensis]|nr:hypothetical protein [Azoarcus taiwanensis]
MGMSTGVSLFGLRGRQGGAVSLFITVIIVLAIGLLTYTMTNTTTVENRMTSSDLRSKQAFHAAQAGLDFALQQFVNGDVETLNASCAEIPVNESNDEDAGGLDDEVEGGPEIPVSDGEQSQSPSFQLLFGEIDPQCPYEALGLQTKAVIRSIGRSSDGSAVRVLEVTVDLWREWDSNAAPVAEDAPPPNVVVSAVVARGNAHFIGAPEIAPCQSIEACEALASPGKKNVNISNVDSTLVTAGGNITGGNTGPPNTRLQDQHKDGNNAAIAGMTGDQFFESIMGSSKTDFRSGATEVSAGEALPNLNVNPVVWHEGDLQVNGGTLGSPEKPVTLVVDGNLTLVGNVIIWGVVYTTGDDFSAGTSKIFGALVAENNITASTGNASVYYNDDLATVQAPMLDESGEISTALDNVKAYYKPDSWREIPASSQVP